MRHEATEARDSASAPTCLDCGARITGAYCSSCGQPDQSPFITHTLILKEGRAVASGPVKESLTSKSLSQAFDSNLTLRHRNHRYTLTIIPTTRGFPKK